MIGGADLLGPMAADGLPLWLPEKCPALDGEFTAEDVDWLYASWSTSGSRSEGAAPVPSRARSVRLDFFEYDWRSNSAH